MRDREGKRMRFVFTIEYFKETGKWYTTTNYEWDCTVIQGTREPYMNDFVAHIRGLRDSGGQGAMPGLSSKDGGWSGYIVVHHDDGFPTLILPPSAENGV